MKPEDIDKLVMEAEREEMMSERSRKGAMDELVWQYIKKLAIDNRVNELYQGNLDGDCCDEIVVINVVGNRIEEKIQGLIDKLRPIEDLISE